MNISRRGFFGVVGEAGVGAALTQFSGVFEHSVVTELTVQKPRRAALKLAPPPTREERDVQAAVDRLETEFNEEEDPWERLALLERIDRGKHFQRKRNFRKALHVLNLGACG